MFPVFSNSLLNSSNNVQNFKNSVNKVNEKLSFENSLSTVMLSSSSSSIVHKQLKIIENHGVFAAEYLKKDLKSLEICSLEFLSCCVSIEKLNIEISKDGILKPLEDISNWLRYIQFSPDVHSNNAIIEITDKKLIQLRILKDIKEEEEIKCWFNENILGYMSIPFLVPANIRGNNCYTCHICNTSYETPNPLKIHLALLCGQQSLDILWIRLHNSLQKLTSSSSASLSSSFTHINLFQNTSNPMAERFMISKSFSPTTNSLLSSHSQRFSAFKPVTSTTTSSSFISSSSSSSLLPSSASQSSVISLANAAAQIETIVSNMGNSKQGHLCIYCGKIYSRKYGLKIHIRTHTGFKPLKCKFCFRPFGDPSNLNKHLRLHLQSKDTTHKCHLCLKVLGRRRDLQRHIQTRHPEIILMNDERIVTKGASSDDD